MSDDFDLAGTGPHVEWRPDFPGFRTKFTGEVIDACSCFGVDIDVNVAIEVKTVLRLAAGGGDARDRGRLGHQPRRHPRRRAVLLRRHRGGVLARSSAGSTSPRARSAGVGSPSACSCRCSAACHTMKQLFDAEPDVRGAGRGVSRGGRPPDLLAPASRSAPRRPARATSRRPPSPSTSCGAATTASCSPARCSSGSPRRRTSWSRSPRRSTGRARGRPARGPVGEWSAFSEFEIAQVDGGYPAGDRRDLRRELHRRALQARDRAPRPTAPPSPTCGWAPSRTSPATRSTDRSSCSPTSVPTWSPSHRVPPLTPEEKQAHERFVSRWQTRFCNILDPGLFDRGGQMAIRWMVDEHEGEDGAVVRPPPLVDGDRRLWVVRAFGLDPSTVLVVDDPDDPSSAGSGDRGRPRRGRRRRGDGPRGSTSSTTATSSSSPFAEPTVVSGAATASSTCRCPSCCCARSGSRPPRRAGDGSPGIRAAVGPGARGRPRRRRSSRRPRRPRRARRRPAHGLGGAGSSRPTVAGRTRAAARADTARRGSRCSYRDRPWTDGLAFAGGGIWARLDDDRQTVRTYKVVDSLVL